MLRIVTITPLNKGVFREELTYFTVLDVRPGAIVAAPVGNRQILGLVLAVKDLSAVKTQVKRSDFALKKIERINHQSFFRPEFITACQRAAEYFAAPLGQIIKSLTPKLIIDGFGGFDKHFGRELSAERLTASKLITNNSSVSHRSAGEKIRSEISTGVIRQNKFVLQEPDKERFVFYKGLIRESFARRKSVFFCLPTNHEVERCVKIFGKGITPYAIALHSDLSKKEIRKRWTSALESDHPVLVLATPLFLSLPRADLDCLILERENSGAYKDPTRPHLDFRRFAEFYAESLNLKLVFGDAALRSETIFRAEKGDYVSLSKLKYRILSPAEQFLVDARRKNDKDQLSSALCPELSLLIKKIHEHREKLFIFSLRGGYAPVTACHDCGNLISCDRCSSPLVIHKIVSATAEHPVLKYIYICHKCGKKSEVKDNCPICDSWHLTLLGHGVEKVEEEIAAAYPDWEMIKIVRSTGLGAKKMAAAAERFQSGKHAVLIGTEIALPYLEENIDNVAVLGLDSLFSLPNWSISEKIVSLLLTLRQLAAKRFIIQTRRPDEKVFGYVLQGNLLEFYREEIAERMKWGYSPFRILIKITRQGEKMKVLANMKWLETAFKAFAPEIFPAFTTKIKNQYVMHALFRRPAKEWPNKDLLAKLKTLSPDFIIDVEPENVL